MSIDKRSNFLKSCVDNLLSCLEYVQQYSHSKDEHINILQNITKDYCEIDKYYLQIQAACDATEKHFDNQDCDFTEDVEEVYCRYLDEQTNTSSYTNHPIWRKIEKCIKANSNNDRQGSSNESDEDINLNTEEEEGIIPSQFEPPVDPITKKPIEDPCRNKRCGHIYEYSTIMDHLNKIKQNKVKPRCPYIGCTNLSMRSTFIIRDTTLKEQIQMHVGHKNSNVLEHSQSSQLICDDTF